MAPVGRVRVRGKVGPRPEKEKLPTFPPPDMEETRPMFRFQTRVKFDTKIIGRMTFEQFEALMEKFRGLCEAEVHRNRDFIPSSVVLIFEAPDEYELAVMVKDLEEELEAYAEQSIEIPRPQRKEDGVAEKVQRDVEG